MYDAVRTVLEMNQSVVIAGGMVALILAGTSRNIQLHSINKKIKRMFKEINRYMEAISSDGEEHMQHCIDRTEAKDETKIIKVEKKLDKPSEDKEDNDSYVSGEREELVKYIQRSIENKNAQARTISQEDEKIFNSVIKEFLN